ncbi:multidrug transporter [Sphingopyxis sp. H071]|nr:multidrug transporter [Sphingopyxis sp. H057]KTE53485.1 multidrug transporter [Sphingopyxis sp. H073]KTE56075.1 multidrug transporter [Sphingopyxis sp. H071]KTE62810.1 multidrug transporter [Sphingopyxis sp. H107]KTE67043.1 multidrug transporter [Sphingopyxis sp. H100]KTE74483.1 multidrug transporter [Sphingopyxis sp. H081]KTE81535.1 multidrug transporter [Sphingopyxis sp. H067]
MYGDGQPATNYAQKGDQVTAASRSIPADRMAVLFAIMLVAAAGNTAMQSILPAIGAKLHIPDVWVSLAFSWSALLWVLTAPHWARQSDKRGRKALMALGVIGFFSSMALCGLTLWAGLEGYLAAGFTFIVFAIFRSLYGGLGSASPPAVQAYVASRTDPEQRTQALSLVSSSFGLGTVIGPAIAPFFILPMVGLAGPLLVFALIGLIVLVMLRWRLPDDVPRFAARGAIASYPLSAGPSEPTAEEENELDPAEQEPLHWRDRRVRPWLLAGFFGGQAQAMMLGVVGFLILDRLHLRLKPDEGAAITGIVLMAGAFATLLAQWGLIPILKLTPRPTVLAGAALAILGILMTGLAQDLHAIVIGFASASLGFGLFRPGFTAGASLSVPRRDQGAVAGMTASINGSAYIISPAIGVLLYNWHPMVAYGLMAAFCVWLMVWGWSALRQDQPANS